MLKKSELVTNLIQIYSLVIKDLKLKFRYKLEFVVEFIAPLFTIFFPYIIFNTLFELESQAFGEESYYSQDNFILFLLLGYIVSSLIFLLWTYKDQFYDEKTWKTLNSVFIAPVSKFNVLMGYLLSGVISKGFPIIFITILCYLLYPIPLLNLMLVLLILFCISLTFAGMGFIIGLFEIVNENISASLTIGISFISLVSCVFYPIQIFPVQVQFIIKLNPLYYYLELLRLSWWLGVDPETSLQYLSVFHFMIVFGFTILTPLLASILFS
ncbi:MAG: hypothetical protein GF353_05255, partial [Candidatus Lokiarchaeota archaeon]|nr:hypothetical protein [Candidatus Lokiarchaeota archaeon]